MRSSERTIVFFSSNLMDNRVYVSVWMNWVAENGWLCEQRTLSLNAQRTRIHRINLSISHIMIEYKCTENSGRRCCRRDDVTVELHPPAIRSLQLRIAGVRGGKIH